MRAGARRVFPLGLGEQPVGLAGHPGEPGHILLGIVPAHIDDGRVPRPQPTSPARPSRGQPPTETQASQSANVTSNLETANGLAIVTRAGGLHCRSGPFQSAGDPIMNSPAGTTIISGQSLAHSLKAARLQRPLSLGLEHVGLELARPCRAASSSTQFTCSLMSACSITPTSPTMIPTNST